MEQAFLLNLGIALGLGLLVGWQRERAASHLGGVRTFPLVTLLGSTCGLLADRWGGWIVAAGFASVLGLAVMSNLMRIRTEDSPDPGQTTEASSFALLPSRWEA
jgi:hypothetical protein